MKKLIIIHYVYVGNSTPAKARQAYREYIEHIVEPNNSYDMVQYTVPVATGESRVECINPVIITDERQQKQLKDTLSNLEEKNRLWKIS